MFLKSSRRLASVIFVVCVSGGIHDAQASVPAASAVTPARPSLNASNFAVSNWPVPNANDLSTKMNALYNRHCGDVDFIQFWRQIATGSGIPLQGCAPPGRELQPRFLGGQGTFPSPIPAAAPAANWELAVINGVSDFLAERAKSELRLWITDNALENLCREKGQAFEYFPATCQLKKMYSYGAPTSEAIYVKSFRSDLTTLPAYLVWKNEGRNNDAAWGYVLTNYYLSLRSHTQNDQSILSLTAGLAQAGIMKDAVKDGGCLRSSPNCSLYWAGTLTEAYLWSRSASSDKERAYRFIAGLFIALDESANKPATNALTTRFLALAATAKDDFGKISDELLVLKDIESQLKAEFARLKVARESKQTDQEQLAIQIKIIELSAKTVAATEPLIKDLGLGDSGSPSIEQAMNRTESIAKIAGYMSVGQYSDAFSELAPVASCLAGKVADDEPICNGWKQIRCGDDNNADSCKSVKQGIATIGQHMPLVIGLADAKTSEDVKHVLDNTASPAGAWRLKQTSDMNSITALVGGKFSSEQLRSTTSGNFSSYTGNAIGVFAPVGIDFTWATSDQRNSYGILLSVIDLGNPVSARLSGNSTSQVVDTTNNAQLRDVLSLGIYAHRNIENSPLVYGIGVSYSPTLRRALTTGGTQSNLSSFQLGVFMAIDITMFPF